MIELKNLWPIPLKRDGLLPASNLWGTHRTFVKGDNYLVLAPSGKGKSTLLHLLYGLRHDYDGQLLIDQQEGKTLSPTQWLDLRRQKLSIVFQDLRLFPNLTALENIQLKAQMSVPETSTDEIHQMAAALHIEELLAQEAGSLSYGQQQRVAIIRALSQPFDYLLLDEPFSHLDEENVQAASVLISRKCLDQKAGVIIASLGERFSFEYQEIVQL